jgi:hypothetical protein
MALEPRRLATGDPSTWCDYASALATVQGGKADGVAYALTTADPFVVINLNHCRHPGTRSIDVWAQNFLDVARDSHAEVTPGGDGCRIWGLTADDTGPIDRKFSFEIDGKAISVELFRRAPKILPITGDRLDDIEELVTLDKALDWALMWGERREVAAKAETTQTCDQEEPETPPAEAPPTDDPKPEIDEPAPEPAPKRTKAPPPPPSLEIELTRLTKVGGPLTKRISLAADGTLLNDGAACVMSRGAAERIKVADVAALATLIEELKPSQALALGNLRADLPDKVEVATKKRLNGTARPDIIARTSAAITYRGPAFILLDYDTKAMPAGVTVELKRAGGFWPTLVTVLPALSKAARVTRRSTSAGLSRTDTGAALPGSDGIHVYVAAKDGADSERFLKTLHERCWLAGFGWMMVGAGGTVLERSIVDRMVGGPERLVFEGGPILVPPLAQDKESRRPIAVDGAVLNTAVVCPPLSIVERARLDELKAKERDRLAPELAKSRSAFIKTQASKLVARTGMSASAARVAIARQCEGILRPDIELPFDDETLTGCTVGDVLDDPERFEGETLADPLEGVAYGRCVAKIMRRADGTPWIHSFAHGRTIYELKHDAASVRKAMQKADKADVVATFTGLAAGADLDAGELAELRQLAKKLSGISLRVIDDGIKVAQQKQAASNAKAARARRAAHRRDPRPQIRAPSPNEPWLPQMTVLNEVIGKVTAARPPARDIDDDAMRVRKLPVPNMHAFTQSEVNVEPEETTE